MNFTYTAGLPARYVQAQPIFYGEQRLLPWFCTARQWPCRQVVFGHWARLDGQSYRADVVNIDGGCVYGGDLIALNCETGKRYRVKCQ